MTELWQMSGLTLGEAIARRGVSAVEALDAIIARVEAVNPEVNAIVTLVTEHAREEARAVDARLAAGHTGGPLFGVPVSIKDLIETKGTRTTFGSLLRQDFVPEQDAILFGSFQPVGAFLHPPFQSQRSARSEHPGRFHGEWSPSWLADRRASLC
jgi:Asp-tRNA(Asn)/Glu-tRNA(Gln) amidotransferase A subunit family amidase